MNIKKILKKSIIIFLAVMLTAAMTMPVLADNETTMAAENSGLAVTEIYDYQDLLKVAENPGGSYKLMADIDLKDVIWEPLDFSGTFDGNGHAVLNATINQTSSGTRKTYDGNLISYDTYFAGFFGILENASVKNLKILGLKVNIDTDKVAFAGGFTGFMEKSDIDGCSVEGEIKLLTSGKSFGVGGMAGFGNGSITNSSSDMTLICIDKDAENKDEQFMGGAYASGYIDLDKNDIKIQGYDSDHGYVHDGGLIGMYVLYPQDDGYQGYVTNNKVSGKITFFEDNEDRRAYCEPVAGEIMNWTFAMDGNETDFTRDEVFDYSTDLLPHYCSSPEYEGTVTASTCTEYGYTTMNCKTCGEYSYKTNYTVLGHEVAQWNAAADKTGVEQGTCTKCGTLVYAKAGSDNAEDATQEATGADKQTAKKSSAGTIIIIIVIIVILIAAFVIFKKYRENKRRREAYARREAMARRNQSYERARARDAARRGNPPQGIKKSGSVRPDYGMNRYNQEDGRAMRSGNGSRSENRERQGSRSTDNRHGDRNYRR